MALSSKSPLGVLLLLLLLLAAFPSLAQKKRRIELLNADELVYDESNGEKFKRLRGHVSFKHEDVLMDCDSAWMYNDNRMDAFSNVHIRQGDTLNLYGNKLKYNGDTKTADMSGNVKLIDNDITLTTEALTYDMRTNIGSYTTPGKIINKDNTLTSKRGYYYERSHELFFKDDVKLVNPEYTMTCDTLRYNTVSRVSYFLGPTKIVSKENTITCRSGWYDSERDISQFSKKARIDSKDQIIKGDSIYYDRKKGFGKVIGSIEMIDTLEKIVIRGHYAEHWEGSGKAFVTKHAELEQIYKGDTMYMHGDTLKAAYTNDQLKVVGEKEINASKDTVNKFSKFHRVVFAYRHVGIYKRDLQGRCDSLMYSMKDSVMRLYHDPVLWADKNQLTGDTIFITTGNGKVKDMLISGAAFISTQEDTIRFNQIKGKRMKGYFNDNKLEKIFVQTNGETVYYAKDKEKFIGVNKALSTDLWIYMKDNDVKQITFLKNPEGILHPMEEVSADELKLEGFNWRAAQRPLVKDDIFKVISPAARPVNP
jgi:lipopolysaccharide export system protein LptA